MDRVGVPTARAEREVEVEVLSGEAEVEVADDAVGAFVCAEVEGLRR